MIRIVLFFLLFTFSINSQDSIATPMVVVNLNDKTPIRISKWKYYFGNHENGADITLDDSNWKIIDRSNFNKNVNGIHWFRSKIRFTGTFNTQKNLMIWISKLPSAFEIYWDGNLIGRNGIVSDSKNREIPGNYIYYTQLKDIPEPGKEHFLAVKVSNYHGELVFGGTTSFFTIVGYYSDWFDGYSISINRHYFNLGLLLITCIMCFSLFIAISRNLSFLFLGVFCIIEISFSLTFILINLRLINIQQVDYIYMVRNMSFFMEGILVNSFLILKYKIPKKFYHLAVVIFITIFIEFLYKFQFINISTHHFILYGYAAGLMFYSTRLKKSGSFVTLLGILALFFLNLLNILIQSFNIFGLSRIPFPLTDIMYIIFISSIIISTGLQIKQKNQEHKKSRNLSQRLEMELLKRNIKPHFIMNTLFSVISLIRKEPSRAIEMIQALAEEFQIVNKISSKKLITIEEEIELCCKHLKIMEFRRNAKYRLETFGINKGENVPPMIFHTLVENGITHSYKIGENGEFKLFFKQNSEKKQYLFQNGGSKLNSLQSKSNEDIETGTGLNYVKARLNESYTNNWDIKYGIKNNIWEVEINIQN